MKRATAVIGAGFGDEGKGTLVDFIAAGSPGGPKVVVRFNGGAQAGHTVVADGKRHVFSHFGSGTLAGADTYLARHFVCNPVLFWHELRQLNDLGTKPVVGVDPRCAITTPYDMIINQLVEESRGDRRHGSVGVGFGETIERCGHPSFRLLKENLSDRKLIEQKLRLVRDHWMPARLRQFGIRTPAKDDLRLSDAMLAKTVEAFAAFEAMTALAGAEFLDDKSVIFEGAQGLRLDMDGPNFPHVTRSNTGLTNVVPLAKAAGLYLDVVYATRPYLTKHGAGPLPGEYVPDPPLVDETNVDHPFQGKFRYGTLDPAELRKIIDADVKVGGSVVAGWSLGLTCLDHAGGLSALPVLTDKLGRVGYYSVGVDRSAKAKIIADNHLC